LVSQGDFFFVLALKVQVFSQVVLRKMTACAGLPLMPGRRLLSQRGKSKQRPAKGYLWNPFGGTVPEHTDESYCKGAPMKMPLSELHRKISLVIASVGGHFQSARVGSYFGYGDFVKVVSA